MYYKGHCELFLRLYFQPNRPCFCQQLIILLQVLFPKFSSLLGLGPCKKTFRVPGSGSAEHAWKLSQLLCKNIQFVVTNASHWLVVTDVETLSWTLVSCLAVELSHHSHLVRLPIWKPAHTHLMWRWDDTWCRNVDMIQTCTFYLIGSLQKRAVLCRPGCRAAASFPFSLQSTMFTYRNKTECFWLTRPPPAPVSSPSLIFNKPACRTGSQANSTHNLSPV